MQVRPTVILGWLFVAVLLATGPLPAAVKDQSFSTYLSAGGLGALGLIGGMYAAEVARARSLRRRSLPVDGIRLGAFGGQLIAPTLPDNPRDLRRFAWSGPVALLSCALVAGGAAVGFATGSGSAFRLLMVTAGWVAALLAMFGLVELLPRPGGPGGQLLVARAWRRSGSRSDGEYSAARAGVRSGYGLGIAAAAATLFVSPLAIWLLPLAAIIVVTSRAALSTATLRRSVAHLRVRDVMSPPLPETRAWATVNDALESLSAARAFRASGLLVRDVDATWAGVAPLPLLIAVPGDDRDTARVRQFMISRDQVGTVRMNAPLAEALDELSAHPVSGLVVVLADDAGPPDSVVTGGTTGTNGTTGTDVAGVLTSLDIAHAAQTRGGHAQPFRMWPPA